MKEVKKIEEKIIELIYHDFIKIKNKGWIKGITNGTQNIGRTFENELSIKGNSMPYSDYFGIEIKCFSKKENDFFTLFSLEPTVKEQNLVKRIARDYGYPDQKYTCVNALNTWIDAKEERFISKKYKGTLYIDDKCLRALISDRRGMIVNSDLVWDLEAIKDKFHYKVEYLAIIKADKKKYNNTEYFKYEEIKVYKFKDIQEFIKLLNTGEARINFKISVIKKGVLKGKTHNHGTSFQIRYQSIEKIYKRIK